MTIEEKLKEFIVEHFLFGETDKLSNEVSLYDSGIIDSTGMMEIVAFIEESFNIKIEDEELIPENLDNISSIVTFLIEKKKII